MNQHMEKFFTTHGLIHQTCPYTPQQNGVAERKNRTLLIGRALMFEAHIPPYFSPEVIASATYLTNRLPSKTMKFKTLLETLHDHTTIPSFHSLPKLARNKLEPRAVKCIFVGYGVNQKGYRCFDSTRNKLYTTMDCDFFESSYFYPQLRPQGEITCDDLSWLTHSLTNDLNPKEQVIPQTLLLKIQYSFLLKLPLPCVKHLENKRLSVCLKRY